MNKLMIWPLIAMVLCVVISCAKAPQTAGTAANCLSFYQDAKQMITAKNTRSYWQIPDGVNLQPQFKDSYDVAQPYSDYLQSSRQQIAERNRYANVPCDIKSPTISMLVPAGTPNVIDLIAPFELRQPDNKKAILLIHGLTDSPYLFHDLAYSFYQQGFNVRTMLLPGHGTAPSDLLHVTYENWRVAVGYGINRTVQDFEQVYVGGFSTGGALILDHLNRQPVSDKIAGLLMWAPAVEVANWMTPLSVVMRGFLDWETKESDTDFAKYESFTYNAAAQVYLLTRQFDVDDLKVPDIPLLVVVSEADHTISAEATLELARHWYQAPGRTTQAKDQVIYYGDKAKALKLLPESAGLTVPACKEGGMCALVKNVAHTAVTNSYNNPHYGKDGTYRNCNHYADNDDDYLRCKTESPIASGEINADNPEKYKPLQRLTYNPYYDEMLSSISEFIR